MLNLDTHIVLHLLAGSLTAFELSALRGQELGVSSIVLWELAKLKQLGRIAHGPDEPALAEFLRECTIWEIDAEVAVQSTRLDFRGDPADELIAATSIVHHVPLLTRDAVIRSSKMVPLAHLS
ncbi:MAG: hypothetical protein AMXMBFR81_00850 [Chthonomonas sp.]